MALINLSNDEVAIVGECLRAAVDGPFFPDWEFETLIGLSRDEVRRLAMCWPSLDRGDEHTIDAVISVLNNLVGYPHGRGTTWSSFVSVEPSAVSALLRKVLNGEVGS